MTVALLELIPAFRVVLHQLSEGGKLLTSVEIKEVARVLDLDMGDFAITSTSYQNTKRKVKWNKKLITNLAWSLVGKRKEYWSEMKN